MESNKPYWDDLEPWAYFIACDENGQWYQYEKQPPFSKIYTVDGVHKWNTAENSKFSLCKNVADGEWAKLYWKSSVEARPSSNPQEVVKPDWSTAPSWANWLACEGVGSSYSCEWWWYASEPALSESFNDAWENTGGDAGFSGYSANPKWASLHWKESLEHKPDCEAKPVKTVDYSSSKPSKQKRVTIFLDFDSPADDDAALANLIAKMLVGNMSSTCLSSAGSSVDVAKIAVGVTKYEEIRFSYPDGEFYIVGEEPDPDDDDDDDDDDEF